MRAMISKSDGIGKPLIRNHIIIALIHKATIMPKAGKHFQIHSFIPNDNILSIAMIADITFDLPTDPNKLLRISGKGYIILIIDVKGSVGVCVESLVVVALESVTL
jgi:hypothetical protein